MKQDQTMNEQKRRILIVDDDQAILKSLGDYLSMKGYSVETVKTGKEAIEKSKSQFFNLAVLDIKLPDIEGTELLTKMHETEPRTIKIMLTGFPNMTNAVESLNKRADAYVVKPVEPEKLLKLVEQKLGEQDRDLKMDKDKLIKYIESRDKEFENK
jgi:DNA-binding NtrC family response regulator